MATSDDGITDTERLDWIDENFVRVQSLFMDGTKSYRFQGFLPYRGRTLREAIDENIRASRRPLHNELPAQP